MDTLIKKTHDDYSHFIGVTFGWLTLTEVSNYPVTKYQKVKFVCRCGNLLETPLFYVVRGSIRTCGCGRSIKNSGDKSYRWSGHGEISGTYWKNLRRGAEVRNIPFLITKEEIWQLFLDQERRCALTGIILTFPKTRRIEDVANATASLDRIDASQPYILSNLQWVDKVINIMKQSMNNEEFIKRCWSVALHTKDN